LYGDITGATHYSGNRKGSPATTISAAARQRGRRPHSSHATAAAANPKAAISLNAFCGESTNNKPMTANKVKTALASEASLVTREDALRQSRLRREKRP
jgi:hypothetical protein